MSNTWKYVSYFFLANAVFFLGLAIYNAAYAQMGTGKVIGYYKKVKNNGSVKYQPVIRINLPGQPDSKTITNSYGQPVPEEENKFVISDYKIGQIIEVYYYPSSPPDIAAIGPYAAYEAWGMTVILFLISYKLNAWHKKQRKAQETSVQPNTDSAGK